MESGKIPASLCRAVSLALHPLILPVYMVVFLMCGSSVMAVIPTSLKWYFCGMVALGTFVIPALTILLLNYFGFIPDLSMETPKERIIPMIIVTVCYITCYAALSRTGLSYLINKFILGALMCVMLAFIVNFFWKISIHLTAMGGMLAVMAILNFTGFARLPYTMMLFIILAGMLASARLYLGFNNPAQTAAGFIGGFTVAGAAILFL